MYAALAGTADKATAKATKNKIFVKRAMAALQFWVLFTNVIKYSTKVGHLQVIIQKLNLFFTISDQTLELGVACACSSVG
jgi:hypothetical protein